MKKIIKQITVILLPLVLSILIWISTKNDIFYISTLNRNINIPSVIFPIVWTILYLLMGFWSFLYEQDYNFNLTLIIYWISLLFNFVFSFILFSFHQILLSFIDIIFLLICIIYLFINTLIKKKKYAYLLLPYIIWLCIALTLTLDLLINN